MYEEPRIEVVEVQVAGHLLEGSTEEVGTGGEPDLAREIFDLPTF